MLSPDASKQPSAKAQPAPADISELAGPLARTVYAKSAKELISFIHLLRASGAHSDVSLPRVAVIGNQSAGKSSLVEAIAHISVPRDAGTCTRCPMELRLSSSSEQWTCRISIRWEYDSSGRALNQVKEVPFGEPFTAAEKTERMLRCAQVAVLNSSHKLDVAYYLEKDEETLKLLAKQAGQSFSRNVVCVELSGPDLPDLSFIDLPGIIQNDSGNGEVELVEGLVQSYIQDHHTLILVVSPMSDDLRNQKAAQLARKADPNGSRTINVLTKPDAISEGAIDVKQGWVNVMEGREHRTKYGYYCVRLPDDAERRRDITPAEAREAEAAFFAKKAPWSTTAHRHRFGIDNLVQCLSDRLVSLTCTSLPGIQRDVAAQRSQCARELDALPEKTADPWRQVDSLARTYALDIAQFIMGSPTHTSLVQGTKKSYDTLAAALSKSSPPFVPLVESVAAARLAHSATQPQDCAEPSQKIYLDTVRYRIGSCLTRELPNNVPYTVKCAFIQDFQRDWDMNVTCCMDEIEGTFTRVLTEIIDKHFGRFDALKRAALPIVLGLVEEHATVTRQQLKYILKYEANPPTTRDTERLSELYGRHLASYQAEQEVAQEPEKDNSQGAGRSTAGAAETWDPSVYESELSLMAEIKAYFDLARARVFDGVEHTIDEHLLYSFSVVLGDTLVEKLGLTADGARARCERYLAEDPDVAALREELLAKKKRLEAVQKALHEFAL